MAVQTPRAIKKNRRRGRYRHRFSSSCLSMVKWHRESLFSIPTPIPRHRYRHRENQFRSPDATTCNPGSSPSGPTSSPDCAALHPGLRESRTLLGFAGSPPTYANPPTFPPFSRPVGGERSEPQQTSGIRKSIFDIPFPVPLRMIFCLLIDRQPIRLWSQAWKCIDEHRPRS